MIFLIGNKLDLEDKREVSFEEANKFKNDNNIDLYMETSAKTGYNIKEVFVEATKLLYNKYKENKAKQNEKNGENKKEEKEESENNEEESEEEIEKEKNETNEEKMCSKEDHKNIQAISYCQKCEVYMCNKCESFHSDFLQSHKEYVIKINGDNKNNEFTGLCKEKNHSLPFEYFCKDHNKLICPACISKVESKNYGSHKDCEVCPIKKIKKEKKNILDKSIEHLENISKTIDSSIKQVKGLYEEKTKSVEILKKEIQNIFTKIRNNLNKREDELLTEVDKQFIHDFFKEDFIKEIESIPNKIKTSLENIQLIKKDWEDKSKMKLLINNCINIENNITEINKLEDKIKKSIELNNLEYKFQFSDDRNVEEFINIIKELGKIYSEKEEQNKENFNEEEKEKEENELKEEKKDEEK